MTTSPTPSDDPQKQDETESRLDAADEQEKQEVLDDPIKQEQYRQEYLRQLRLRSCPGCGETEIF